jgi:hypothetical protein
MQAMVRARPFVLRYLPRQIVDVLLEFLLYKMEFSKLVDVQRHLALQLDYAVRSLFALSDASEDFFNRCGAAELTQFF